MEKFALSGQDQLKRAYRKNSSAAQYSQDSDVRDTLLLLSLNIIERHAEDTEPYRI